MVHSLGSAAMERGIPFIGSFFFFFSSFRLCQRLHVFNSGADILILFEEIPFMQSDSITVRADWAEWRSQLSFISLSSLTLSWRFQCVADTQSSGFSHGAAAAAAQFVLSCASVITGDIVGTCCAIKDDKSTVSVVKSTLIVFQCWFIWLKNQKKIMKHWKIPIILTWKPLLYFHHSWRVTVFKLDGASSCLKEADTDVQKNKHT